MEDMKRTLFSQTTPCKLNQIMSEVSKTKELGLCKKELKIDFSDLVTESQVVKSESGSGKKKSESILNHNLAHEPVYQFPSLTTLK